MRLVILDLQELSTSIAIPLISHKHQEQWRIMRERLRGTKNRLGYFRFEREGLGLIAAHPPIFPYYDILGLYSDNCFLINEISERLQLFYEVSIMFFGAKYPTTNTKYAFKKIKDISSLIFSNFKKYFLLIHEMMGMVVVLDPRYKLKFVDLLFPVLYGEEKINLEFQYFGGVCQIFFSIIYNFVLNIWFCIGGGAISISSCFSYGLSFDHHIELKKSYRMLLLLLISMMNQVLNEKLLPKDMKFDLLVWWKTNGFKYPKLQMIAKDILTIYVSTVALYSTFRTSGRLVNPYHSRLHTKTLEALMCAQSWLLNEIRGTKESRTPSTNDLSFTWLRGNREVYGALSSCFWSPLWRRLCLCVLLTRGDRSWMFQGTSKRV
uniref:HAT C-terminal dimerisation domain-containing protein n=1 Tax=Lactuca sativa TaxID=4236 RepID=A0A9R1VQ08_LACSA|nr:hypothetical protein LSAT_V11C400194480 [Lactuca sativa]